MAKCLSCNHPHSEYDGQCFEALKGKCDCKPESYLPDHSSNPKYISEAYRFDVLSKIQDIHQKIEWILTSIPGTRNMNSFEFIVLCWHYFTKFRFGDMWTKEVFEKIQEEAEPETIRRARQKVCHEELEILRKFEEELKAISKKEGEGSQAYWKLTEQIKEFWKNTKYIPNDIKLLRKKKLKESAIFEYSIQEIDDIYFSIEKRSLA